MRPNHHIPTRPTTMTMTTPGGSAARRTAGTSACRSAGSSRPSRYNPPPPKAGPLCIIYSISLCVGIYVGVGVWMSSTTYIATPPAPRHTPTVTVTKPQRHRQKGAADPLDAAAQHRERASLHGALRGLGPVLLPKGGYIHIICVIAEGGDGPAGGCMYNGVCGCGGSGCDFGVGPLLVPDGGLSVCTYGCDFGGAGLCACVYT